MVCNLRDCLCQSKPVHCDGDKRLLEMHIPKLGLCQLKYAPFEGVFESATVAERGLRDANNQFQGGAKRVFPVVETQIQIHAAHAESIHFAVEVEIHLTRPGYIAICADALNQNFLPIEIDFYALITF